MTETQDDKNEVEIIEMDQWSSTGDLDDWTYKQMKDAIEIGPDTHTPAIKGGDAEAAQAIFGGDYTVKTVSESDIPRKGLVWFTEGDNGGLVRWKHNVATR